MAEVTKPDGTIHTTLLHWTSQAVECDKINGCCILCSLAVYDLETTTTCRIYDIVNHLRADNIPRPLKLRLPYDPPIERPNGVQIRDTIKRFLIKYGSLTIAEISKLTQRSKKSVSSHLGKMKQNGTIQSERQGRIYLWHLISV